MASKICSLHLVNKKGITRAIARSVLRPYGEATVHFYDTDQVAHAQRLQESGDIDIVTPVPGFIEQQIEAKKEQDTAPGPVAQARAAFEGTNVLGEKAGDGWNSPDDAYKGEDLKDRTGGFAATSSNATKEDSDQEKINPDGSEAETTPIQATTSAWNSPDDAYAGEDLQDRDRSKEAVQEMEENQSTEARKFEERKALGPQDQADVNTNTKDAANDAAGRETEANEVKGDAADQQKEQQEEARQNTEELSKQAEADNAQIEAEQTGGQSEASSQEGDSSEEGESKPSYYLTYQEVEDKTKQELIDWSEKEVPEEEKGDFKLAKSKSATDVKEEVHNFLASKFDTHAE